MFRKALMLAGLLSLVSISAQAQEVTDGTSRVTVQDATTVNGIHDVHTTEDNARGGAILNANGFDLTVKGTIENNTLTAQSEKQISLGGAIFQQGGTLTVEDGTTFNTNTANGYQQSYPEYPQDDLPAGGAIYMTGAEAVFTAKGTVNFTGNKAVSNSESKYSTGGAIHFESIKSATFDQANFSNNQSGAMGGAIYDGNTDLKFSKATFENNQSGSGGAIYMLEYQAGTGEDDSVIQWSADKVTTKVSTGNGSSFTSNTATKNGGAIANFDGKLTVGENNVFSGNKATGTSEDGNGGAIYNAKWIGTPEAVIKGGTSFTGNSATGKGGAIYNAGKLVLDTTAGDITFSGNTAEQGGADIYLEEDSTLTIQDSDDNFSGHKVLFESDNSLAGSGKVTNKGIVHFKGKDPIKDFTGEFIQQGQHAKTILDDTSTSLKMDIEEGELDVSNGANVTLDGSTVKFSGDTLSVGNVLQEEESKNATLTIGSAGSESINIGGDVTVNIEDKGEIDIVNGKLTLNTGDTWDGGTVKLSAGQESTNPELVVDGFSTTKGQAYIQEGGSLTLQNKANVEISGETSVVSGGTVDIEQGTTFSVSNQADIQNGAEVDVEGTLNLKENGKISGGTFNLSDESVMNVTGGTITDGKFNVSTSPKSRLAMRRAGISPIGIAVGGEVNVDGGTLSGGTWDFNNNAKLNVTNNGTINGGTYNFNDSSKGDFNGTVSGTSKFNLKDQSQFDIKGGTFGGEIILGTKEDDEGTGHEDETPKLKVESGSKLSGRLESHKGSSTELSGTLEGNVSLKGDLTVKSGGEFKSPQANIGSGGNLTVESGGKISGGNVSVNNDGKLDVQSGANVNGNTNLKVESGGELDVSGTVDGTSGQIELKDGSTTNVEQSGKLSLSSDDRMNGTVTNKGTVELNGYQGSEGSTGKYTQDGDNAKLDLKGKSNFELSGEEGSSDSITKGSVTVEGGSNLTVKDNGSIGAEEAGDKNVKVDVKGGSSVTVEGEGKIQNSDITIEGKSGEGEDTASKLEVKDGGSVKGGNVNVNDGAELVVDKQGSVSDANITAKNGKITVKGEDGEEGNGGKISGGSVSVTEGSTLDVQKGGTIENGEITVESSKFSVAEGGSVKGGEITLGSGSSFEMAEGSDVSGGEFHFGYLGDIEISGEIEEGAKYNFEGGNTFIIKDKGKVTTSGKDSETEKSNNWDDDTIIQLGKGGTEEETDNPELHWKGNTQSEGKNTHGNGILKGNSGKLTVEGGDQSLNIWGDGEKNGYIHEGVQVELKSGSSIDVQTNGEVTLNGGSDKKADKWEGDVKVSGGKLTVDNMTGKSGKYTQTDGETVVKGTFEMNNKDDSIEKGKLTIDGDGNTATLKQSNGSIEGNAEVVLGENGKLELSGGTTELNENDTWKGEVNVSEGGNLTLSDVGKNTQAKSGKFVQLGGETTVSGTFDMNNEDDSITKGKLNIGNEGDKAGTFNQSKGTIAKEAEVTINSDSELNMTGGTTTLNGKGTDESTNGVDTWKGKINLSGGDLTLEDVVNPKELSPGLVESHGHIQATGGKLTVKGSSNLTFDSEDLIDSGTKFDFQEGSSITIEGSSITFDGKDESQDTWAGDITLENGTLTYNDLQSNGKLAAKGGTLNTGAGSKLTIEENSYIDESVKAAIAGGLTIKGTSTDENRGHVTLGKGDSITGNIEIEDNGQLNLGDYVQMAPKSEEGENQSVTLNGTNAELNFNGEEYLDFNADIKGSNGNINKNGNGDISFEGDTHEYKGNFTVHGSGTLDFYDTEGLGGNLVFGEGIEGKDITIKSDKIMGSTELDKEAKITFETHNDGVDLTLGKNVNVSNGGTLNFNAKSDNLTFEEKVSATKSDAEGSNGKGGNIGAYGKTVTFEKGVSAKDNSTVNVGSQERATLNGVELANSTLNVAGAGFEAKSTKFSGNSTINVMDGVITENNEGTVTFGEGGETVANHAIDIAPRDWRSDSFIVTGDKEGKIEKGHFNVSDFHFSGKAPIDRNIHLRIFKDEFGDDVEFTATDKQEFSPIGWYGLRPSGGPGEYDAYLARYNNQVFRGQVATVANWQNQLTIDNMLFGHMQEINMQYLTQENPNRYAAAFPQFAPYQYNKREGSLWFKPFGNFENLSMGRGIKAENNFYGALVGADFPAIELKRGWTFMPSAYIGYTGAHQNFSHVGMTQNGGQGGVMGSFMHKDFIGTVLAYGGGYGNEMDVTGLYNYAGSYNDKNGNWYVGAATKAAYNFHPSKHFIVQPNFLAAWNLSGEQRWHTNYGDMNMNTGMFNGVAVAPGLNLIYGRETWSMYFTIQYFYNVMSSVNGRAGNVNLPSIGMRHGFLEYGVGATKTWKDRLSGYLQIVVRNVGRTGIGFQGGLMYKL